jgi:hypothetical protein
MARKRREDFMLLAFALFFLVGATAAQAATYYVATTGNDTSNGSQSSPWRTPQKCINAMVAGDICTVGDGNYTDSDSNSVVGIISGIAANGVAGNPITIRSTNPSGAHIILSNNNNGNHGFYVQRNYWIIEGFDITGGTFSGNNVAYSGITVEGATGTVVRNNIFHNIARTICTDSPNGNQGMYIHSANSTMIDSNRFYTIGRMYNGESGCSTIRAAQDHGLYIDGASAITIQRNVFYDITRGWPIQIYSGAGLTTSNANIFNNTFSGKSSLGGNGPAGHMVLGTRINIVNIKNNISHNNYDGIVRCSTSLVSATSVLVEHNLTDSSKAKTGESCPANVTFLNNVTSTSTGFVNATVNDFRLSSNSPAIDAGVLIGLAYNGSAPDIGYFEFGGQQATVTAPKNLRVQ